MWQLRQGVAIDKFAFHHGRLVRLDADLEGVQPSPACSGVPDLRLPGLQQALL